MAKLKVFTWSDGFHAYTVAATSRAKALGAWGVSRDLFKDGDAREIDGGADYDKAVATPGETIKRGLTVDVGRLSKVKPRSPDKAALARVATLEAELAKVVAAHEAAAKQLAAERYQLDRKVEALDSDFDQESAALEAKLKDTRRKLGKT